MGNCALKESYMTTEQRQAIKCAYLDLVGSYQCASGARNGHHWDAHRETIHELEAAFPNLISPISLDGELLT